jgi:di/tricarboxylate transporter
MTGVPFSMFDYAPVGLALTAVILLFLAFGYRLLPKDRQGTASLSASLEKNAYSAELRVPEPWAQGRMTITALERAGPDVRILRIIRDGRAMNSPRGNVVVRASDLIVAEGSARALGDFIQAAQLTLRAHDSPAVRDQRSEEVTFVEAVINLGSPLIDRPSTATEVHGRFGVNLLGVSRAGQSVTAPVGRARLRQGDLILLQGSEGRLSQALRDLELLPLAERQLTLGEAPRRFLPLIVLGLAMVLVGFQLVPVAAAFFGAAVLIVMMGGLSMKEAYRALDGPLLVLIAALIPVSAAIQTTGGDDLVATALSELFGAMPGLLAIGSLMLVSMAVTPFLNNAATVLIMAPIGATLALQLGYRPDPFLMAVAVGAACDFLTPIGHQCNTIVMRPAGYRFGDYARLGAPLSLLVLLAGPPLILMFWPL